MVHLATGSQTWYTCPQIHKPGIVIRIQVLRTSGHKFAHLVKMYINKYFKPGIVSYTYTISSYIGHRFAHLVKLYVYKNFALRAA